MAEEHSLKCKNYPSCKVTLLQPRIKPALKELEKTVAVAGNDLLAVGGERGGLLVEISPVP